jgi:hypothetical protein
MDEVTSWMNMFQLSDDPDVEDWLVFDTGKYEDLEASIHNNLCKFVDKNQIFLGKSVVESWLRLCVVYHHTCSLYFKQKDIARREKLKGYISHRLEIWSAEICEKLTKELRSGDLKAVSPKYYNEIRKTIEAEVDKEVENYNAPRMPGQN